MNRREFLSRTGTYMALGLIVPPFLRKTLARAAGSAGAARSSALPSKILISVNLGGGNDGLNTVIPYADPLYGALRPGIAINNPLILDSVTGLHPSLAQIKNLYDLGEAAIIQGLTYPEPNLSHFRATDIWFSGSSSTDVVDTGWLARYIEAIHPEFPETVPEAPFALQQGLSHEIPLNGARGRVGVAVADPSTFFDLVGAQYTGEWSDELPNTRGGDELAFVRSVDVESFEYAAAIQAASEAGTNAVPYPNTTLGQQLEIVARLISGELDTLAYLTSFQGFDTHVGQLGAHAGLLAQLSQAVGAFMSDLKAQGLDDRVALVTTSEFGRRPFENGGFGTDHGSAAPHFVIGTNVSGGIYGTPPDLENFDQNNNLLMQHDYRQLYASVLEGHFGATPAMASDVLFGSFQALDLFQATTGVTPAEVAPTAHRLHPVAPNPVSIARSGNVTLRFDLAQPSTVSVDVYSVGGRRVAELLGSRLPSGQHSVTWDPRHSAAGTYFVRMQAGAWQQSQKLIVVR